MVLGKPVAPVTELLGYLGGPDAGVVDELEADIVRLDEAAAAAAATSPAAKTKSPTGVSVAKAAGA